MMAAAHFHAPCVQVRALVRGLEKHGGRLMTRAHVEQVVAEGGRAVGVALRGGGVIRAKKAVVSSACSV
jgi:phytoene dehydrogenase-like protein